MKKMLSLIIALLLLSVQILTFFSCSQNNEQDDNTGNEHQCEIPELTEGENGNWWLGDEDTGIPVGPTALEIKDAKSEFVTIYGVEYCKVTITLSDGTVKEVLSELPTDSAENEKDEEEDDDGKVESFVTTASITNGYGGTNGIVCLMTDNDSGKFETMKLVDELYAEYGLVGGWGTVVKNL